MQHWDHGAWHHDSLKHVDVIKWKHFPRYWPFVRGIPRSPENYPHKGQWRGALMFSLICAKINGWVNNREAGDLRCHRAHYDVIVMRRMHNKVISQRVRILSYLRTDIWSLKFTFFSKAWCSTKAFNGAIEYWNTYWIILKIRHNLTCDVITWKHFPRYWPFVRGIHRSPVKSQHRGQWRGALMFSLICVWINGWVKNREAGDLRRYRAHYDIIVMTQRLVIMNIPENPVTRLHSLWQWLEKSCSRARFTNMDK